MPNFWSVPSSRISGFRRDLMRKLAFLLLLFPWVLLAQNEKTPAQSTGSGISGRWVVVADFYGSPIYFSLTFSQQGDKLTGDFDGDKLEGTLSGNSVHFLAKD